MTLWGLASVPPWEISIFITNQTQIHPNPLLIVRRDDSYICLHSAQLAYLFYHTPYHCKLCVIIVIVLLVYHYWGVMVTVTMVEYQLAIIKY